jgi:azurin
MKHYSLAVSLFAATILVPAKAKELNIARAKDHPYVDHQKGREGYRLASEPVNAYRIYDFYQRQADYYLSSGAQLPAIIPAFPGLDGGKHGHWGKNNQNSHNDGRWNEMGHHGLICHTVGGVGADGFMINVDAQQQLHAGFSPSANLSYFRYWDGEFTHIDPYRWGTSRGVKQKGKVLTQFNDKQLKQRGKANSIGWQVAKELRRYLGYFDTDFGIIFSYAIKNAKVLDTLRSKDGKVYHRIIEAQQELKNAKLALFDANGVTQLEGNSFTIKAADGKPLAVKIVSKGAEVRPEISDGLVVLNISSLSSAGQIQVLFGRNAQKVEEAGAKLSTVLTVSLAKQSTQRKAKWSQTIKTTGTLSKDSSSPYVVDDIALPFDNANKSLMFLTDIAFNKKGEAFISTLMGEVWKVSGLKDKLNTATWQRIARGLNQPSGLKIWDGKMFVLERDQITTLEDRNGDGEIDFYGNFSPLVSGLGLVGSHTHTWGLGKDKDAWIHFVSGWSSYRVSPDGSKIEEMTKGLRNCMGFGSLSDGTILVGPQEGTNTPTSEIIQVRKGDNHGFKNNDKLSVPLAYVPRGVDNSTGGFLEVDSPKWGPLGKKGLIGICYGYGSWHQVLFDQNQKVTGHRQAATVPMRGEFLSGVVRGAVNPVDGQVYLVGLDGWGDYAVHDGCLHRVRYTGKPLLEPTGYQVYDNGIRVDFDIELDPSSVTDVSKYFAQMWNYRNSRQYGSPEFSILNPDSLGHDPLKVTKAVLAKNKKSIFVEIPSLQPAMQVHLRMKIQSADGAAIATDLFPTIVKLGDFYSFPGAQAKNTKKSREFVLRNDRDKAKSQSLVTQSGKVDEHAKRVQIKTPIGLKFDVKEFRVKAGESIALELKNIDAMPHNLVIVKPGTKEAVGTAAFKMLNDPKAIEKCYVPDDKSNVIAYTHVVSPKGTHTTYFTAPKKKGNYPYICTFPGHWQAMQGVMIVE